MTAYPPPNAPRPPQRAALFKPKRYPTDAPALRTRPVRPEPPVLPEMPSCAQFTSPKATPDFDTATTDSRPRTRKRLPPSPAEREQMPAFPVLSDAHIHVPNTPEALLHAKEQLLSASALGFDTESRPLFQVGQRDDGPHLVQLATCTDAWLLQLELPGALQLAREVLASPHIAKIGFGLDNDLRSLPRRLGSPLANVHDLDKVFSQHGYGKNLGVRSACAVVLKQSFHKSKRVSTSNWGARVLSPAQQRYAANDAHGPAMIWAALPAWEAKLGPKPKA